MFSLPKIFNKPASKIKQKEKVTANIHEVSWPNYQRGESKCKEKLGSLCYQQMEPMVILLMGQDKSYAPLYVPQCLTNSTE